MLINIDPILNADLLHALRTMGHNDRIVIADGNFPAGTLGRRVVRVDGADAPRVLRAVLAVMPVDAGPRPFVAMRTAAEDGYDAVTREFEAVAGQPLALLEPELFYAEAPGAFVIVQTGEGRFYGNIMIRKGVVPPTSASA